MLLASMIFVLVLFVIHYKQPKVLGNIAFFHGAFGTHHDFQNSYS